MSKDKKSILDKLAEEVDKISDKLVGEEREEVKKEAKQEKTRLKKTAKQSVLTKAEPQAGDKKESLMEELLRENPLEIPAVGDVLEGKIIDISSSSMLVDLGPLGTGIVLGKEMKDGMGTFSKIKKGDKINATLTDLENDEGYLELSIREASYEKAWEDLEAKRDNQEIVPTKILDANKGGLMVEINGITGFLPVSQLSSENYPRVEDGDKNKILEILKKLIGQEMIVRIIDADRETEKLIVSERAANSEKEKKMVAELQVGEIVEGEISGVVDFGAFVKFLPLSKAGSANEKDKLEGLVHISELAWQLIDNPREIVKTGDKIKAKIIGIDDTRISLSIRALKEDPWSKAGEKYKVGDIVKGKVDKINPFGIFVYLDENIHGLAHISEFQEAFPGKRMEEIVKAGGTYDWKILSIEPEEHRMGLVFVKEEKKKAAEEDKKEDKKEKKTAEKPEKKSEKKTKKQG